MAEYEIKYSHITRTEYKYLLRAPQAVKLAGVLRRSLLADPHNGPLGYKVKSLYYDSWDLGDFLEKDAGLIDRKKLRLRLYDEESDLVRLELKEKYNEQSAKTSLALTGAGASAFMAGQRGVLLSVGAAGADLYAAAARRTRPAALIQYRRTAFTWPAFNTRITLDADIEYSTTCFDLLDPNVPLMPLHGSDLVVLEVKYDHALEPFIRRLLSGYCNSRLSLGKYERCLRGVQLGKI